jgi:tRNA (uracil-5-)-methyltransferase
MTRELNAIRRSIGSYKKGATLLLRDSLVIPTTGSSPEDSIKAVSKTTGSDATVDALSNSLERHVCITDHKAIVRERVGRFLFEFPAGSFFQNNNSILEPFTSYVRDVVLGTPGPVPTHLVDAYCGSGLFSITLSPHFSRIAGVEISADSIRYARHNASLNNVPEGRCTFHAGQAEAIFDSVKDYPPAQTVVVIDPPRKGCDTAFMAQLLAFGPATVVYVSCNVHTQARDVGIMLKRSEGGTDGRYKLESLRGIDLFPQTAHVESVAVLRKL